MSTDISSLDLARALTPGWMLRIKDFDALEIHPCAIIGCDSTGGVDAFEDFPTEAEARAFHDRLIAIYSHLAGDG